MASPRRVFDLGPADLETIMSNRTHVRLGAGLVATMGLIVSGTAIFALAAFAQPKAEPAKTEPANSESTTPAPTKAADTSKGNSDMGEAPDGTKIPIISRSSIAIQIEDLKIGDGKEATAASTITINYHGSLASNGNVFDSTRGKEPATFPLARLIPGWQAGIPGMKVGGIRVLHIPYQLAYGDRTIPNPDGTPLIPAKSDLVFAIELKDVK